MFDVWLCELRDVEVHGLDRRALCDVAAASARLRAGLDAFDARLGREIEGLDDDGPGAAVIFRGAMKCSQREADRRARRADALAELPSAADALASGAITAEHVDTLARAAKATSPDAVESSDLLSIAAQRPADLLDNDARAWTRRHQSQESLEAQHEQRRDARRCSVFDNDEGMTVVHAAVDPIVGAKARARIDQETDRLFWADGGRNGGAEARTPEQRRADALMNLILGVNADGTGSPESPPSSTTAPVRTQMLVIAHADGTAEIPGTGPIPASELAKLQCNSDLFGLVFSTDGQPLWHGTNVRLADDNQWRTLIARDGGCGVCNADPSKCEAHHIIFHGEPARGPTDIDNLVLLCKHHHHLIHDHGYQLHQRGDGTWELAPPDQ